MIFESARLIARRFEPRDAEAFAAYRADPEVARYQSWDSFSAREAEDFIASMEESEPGDAGWFQFALEGREDKNLIGDCGLNISEVDNRLAEIGFTICAPILEQGVWQRSGRLARRLRVRHFRPPPHHGVRRSAQRCVLPRPGKGRDAQRGASPPKPLVQGRMGR